MWRPPPPSGESCSQPSPAAPFSTRPTPEDAAQLRGGTSSPSSNDDKDMHTPELPPNTRQLLIDGHALMIPADDVESVCFIRAQIIASYRSVNSGTSTAQGQALLFGAAISETTDGRRPGASAGFDSKAIDHLPAGPVSSAVDSSTTAILCGRHVALQSCPTHPGPDRSVTKWTRRSLWQSSDGFIGDFEDLLDVKRKTQMSKEWAKGRYVDGVISFRGVFAKTQVMEKMCANCERGGTEGICRALVDGGKDDPFVGQLTKCGRCVARSRGCSLRLAE